MSKAFAIVEDGEVVNIAVSDTALMENWIESEVAQIGWTYDGSTFYPPPDPPPPTREEQQAKRQAAFQSEADPLFFKWQAGEGTKEDWEAKREEIRQRYPYPN